MHYLYLKTHNVTGLKYLGQTKNDPHTYKGSGKYWVSHINKHGNDVTTAILLETEDPKELSESGISYSLKWNVVESEEFANLIAERGQGGHTRYVDWTPERREKISNLHKGRSLTPEHVAKIAPKTGEDNHFYGRAHSEDSRKKMSESSKGQIAHNRIPVTVNGVTYASKSEAKSILGISRQALAKLI